MEMQHQRADARRFVAANALGDRLRGADQSRSQRLGGDEGDAAGLAMLFQLICELVGLARRIGADDVTRHAVVDSAAVALRAGIHIRYRDGGLREVLLPEPVFAETVDEPAVAIARDDVLAGIVPAPGIEWRIGQAYGFERQALAGDRVEIALGIECVLVSEAPDYAPQ